MIRRRPAGSRALKEMREKAFGRKDRPPSGKKAAAAPDLARADRNLPQMAQAQNLNMQILLKSHNFK